MPNYVLSAAVQADLTDIATKGASVFASSERGWSPLIKRFKAVVADLGITDRKSDGGKAVTAFMTPIILASLVKSGAYDLAVHRVGSDDDYRPVDAEFPANFTITGAFAVGANLTELAGVKDKPRGLKAWLRGNAHNGLRPDGEEGLRDLINNAKDQVISRFWKKKRKGAGTEAATLDAKVLELYNFLKGARDRWESEGGECISDAELKAWADRSADEILKRKSKARKS